MFGMGSVHELLRCLGFPYFSSLQVVAAAVVPQFKGAVGVWTGDYFGLMEQGI